MPKFIIFDLDGTLVDSLPLMVTVANELAPKYNKKPIKLDNTIRKKGARALIQEHFGTNLLAFARFMNEARAIVKERMQGMVLKKGMPALINLLKKKYTVGILTSNEKEVANSILNNSKVVVDFIHSERSLFGKDKVLKKILKQHNLKSEEIIYIGDETRDIEACKKLHIPVIAVTWGFNDEATLAALEPSALVSSPLELKNVLVNTQ